MTLGTIVGLTAAAKILGPWMAPWWKSSISPFVYLQLCAVLFASGCALGIALGGSWIHESGHYLGGRLSGARMSFKGSFKALILEAQIHEPLPLQRVCCLLGGPLLNIAAGLSAAALAAPLPGLWLKALPLGFAFANLAVGIGALAPFDPNSGGGLILKLLFQIAAAPFVRGKRKA